MLVGGSGSLGYGSIPFACNRGSRSVNVTYARKLTRCHFLVKNGCKIQIKMKIIVYDVADENYNKV